MSKKIEPALTAEEWVDTKCAVGVWWENGKLWNDGCLEERPHALAATCLHHQPFGFTRDDDETWMRIMARAFAVVAVLPGGCEVSFDPEMIRETADKIAALLPPEKEEP